MSSAGSLVSPPKSAAQSGLEYSNDLKRQVARGINRHLQSVECKLRTLDLELVNTKNNIIKNVLRSRAIEKSQVQVLTAQQLLQQQMLALQHPDLPQRLHMRELALSKSFGAGLTTEETVTVFRLAGDLSVEGIAKVLLEALLDFNAKALQRTLEACPAEKSGQIGRELFLQVVRACSSGCISDSEAQRMFDISLASSPDASSIWPRLKARLLRRLHTLYAAARGARYLHEQEIIKQQHFKFPAAMLQRRPQSQAAATAAVNEHSEIASRGPALLSSTLSPSLLSSSLSTLAPMPSTSASHSSSSVLSSASTKKRKHKPARLDALSRDAVSQRDQLLQALDQSRSQQARLQQKLAVSLVDLYSNPQLPPSSSSNRVGPASASRAQYFQSMAAKKLAAFLLPKIHRFLSRRFDQWKHVQRLLVVESDCSAVAKGLAVVRLVRLLQWHDLACMTRRFLAWMQTVNHLAANENEAAAIDIQRFVRGYRMRQQFKELLSRRAAVAIQNVIRVHMAKKLARRVLQRRHIRLCVQKMEKVWISYRWRRTLKKVFLRQRQVRAAVHFQRLFRGHATRRRYHLRLLYRLQRQGVIKFQSLYRRYRAIMLVEKMRSQRRRHRAAINIQRVVRGVRVRKVWRIRWSRHIKAKLIQYGWWCSWARRQLQRRRHDSAAALMQRCIRGWLARRRVKKLRAIRQAQLAARLAARQAAIHFLAPYLLGYRTRRQWKDRLAAHLSRRQQAARRVQHHWVALWLGWKARRAVARLRAERERALQQRRATLTLQRIARGRLARRIVTSLRAIQSSGQPDPTSSWPLYYRLRHSYLTSQNLLYRKQATKIQALARGYLARRRIVHRRRDRSARVLQSFISSRKLIAEARSIRQELARHQSSRVVHVPRIQRIARGFLVRNRLRKRQAVRVLRWVIREVHVRQLIDQAMDAFRYRKAIEAERQNAATTIQSLLRGFIARRRYKKSLKSLQRQRAIRVRAKRVQAALVVQCAYRCYRARVRVIKQRLLYADRERERKQLELLEQSIEGLHEQFMTELMVIRAQTGVRSMLARQEFVEKVRKYREQQDREQEGRRHQHATRIQSRLRGVLGRRRFKKMLPALKLARRMRSLCVECETKPAVRRCRQCRDQFCEDCFDLLHQRGKRKAHTYAAITPDARALGMAYETKDPKAGAATGKDERKKAKRSDWEEFYDAAAQAKYWFNKKTGEASWVNPLK